MSRMLSALVVLLVAQALSFTAAAPARARKQTDLRYRYEQVWSAALRMVRVDLRLAVDDQDPEAGFVLFQYRERGQTVPGSIELVRTEVEGVPYVRVVVQIPSMPMYVEQMMMDRLERKLAAEFGTPPAAPRRPAAPPEEREPREPPAPEGEGDADEEAPPSEGQRSAERHRRPQLTPRVVMRGNERSPLDSRSQRR